MTIHILPPPVGIPSQHGYNPTAHAVQDRHPLAHLMRLRDEAAAQIELLLVFLDATDGDTDLEPYLTGWNGDDFNDDREGDQADDEDEGESGIADLDGLMEQYPRMFSHCDQRVES